MSYLQKNIGPILGLLTLIVFPVSIYGQNHVWEGTFNSDWTNTANWGGAGQPGGVFGYGGTGGTLEIRGNSAALYDPVGQGLGEITSTFDFGRGLVLGNSANGALQISSGEIRLVNPTANTQFSPFMAYNGNASLIINGTGRLDATGNVNDFILFWGGSANHTSTLSVNGPNASFAARGFNLRRAGGGTATINVSNGGTLTVDGFTVGGGSGSNILNFDGGVLQAGRSNINFLGTTGNNNGNNLANTTLMVGNNGITIDTNGFDIGIGQSILAAANSQGGLVKTGAGTLTLSRQNSYLGTTIVRNGVLAVNRNGVLGTAAQGTIVEAAGTLRFNNVNYSMAENFILASGNGSNGRGSLQGGTGHTRLSGNISVNHSRIGVQDGADLTINGQISGDTVTFRHASTGTGSTGVITLRSNENNWTGATNIIGNFGSVTITRDNGLSTDAVLRLGDGNTLGGRLEMNGRSQQVQGLSQLNNSTRGVINNRTSRQSLTLANMTADQTYFGTITGNIDLVMNSHGRIQTLAGNNNYRGITTISNGTLIVNGNHTEGGSYTVASTGTLGGNGRISAAVNVRGTLLAGDGIDQIGSFTINNLTLGSNSVTEYRFNSTTMEGDLIHIERTFQVQSGAMLNLSDLNPTSVAAGTRFTLFSYAGDWSGELFSVGGNLLANESEILIGLNRWLLRYDDLQAGINFSGTSSNGMRFVTLEAIPEPNGLLMASFCLAVSLASRNRRVMRPKTQND